MCSLKTTRVIIIDSTMVIISIGYKLFSGRKKAFICSLSNVENMICLFDCIALPIFLFHDIVSYLSFGDGNLLLNVIY